MELDVWCPTCKHYDSTAKTVDNCCHPGKEDEGFAAIPMSECYEERS